MPKKSPLSAAPQADRPQLPCGEAASRALELAIGMGQECWYRRCSCPDGPCRAETLKRPNPCRPTRRGSSLSATADDRRSPLFRMAFTFGMRRAETRGLTWDRVHLDGGLVRVDRWLWGVRLPSRRCELRRGAGGRSADDPGGLWARVLHDDGQPVRPFAARCDTAGEQADRCPAGAMLIPLLPVGVIAGRVRQLVERCPNPLAAGGPSGSRTHDLRIKSPLLCRLSYRPGSSLAGGRPVRRAAGSAPDACPSRAGRL